MKNLKMRLLACTAALILTLTLLPARASAYSNISNEGYTHLIEASNSMFEAFELIAGEYISRDITLEEMYNAAMRGISELLDPYSDFLTQQEYDSFIGGLSGVFYGVGVGISEGSDGYVFVSELVSGMSAKGHGVLEGDKISAVDGVDMHNQPIDEVRGAIIGDEGTSVSIEFIREAENGLEKFTLTLTRSKLQNESVSVLVGNGLKQMLGVDKIPEYCAYVRISSINDDTALEFEKAIAMLKENSVTRIIMDLRDNGGGFLDQAVDICKLIIPKGDIIHLKNKSEEIITYSSTLEKVPFDKIVVLTNNNTASAAEIISSTVQDSGIGVIVGGKTYGKGIIQSSFRLSYGGVLRLTTDEYFSRDMKKINQNGVTPDIDTELFFVSREIQLNVNNASDGLVNLKRALKLMGYSKLNENRVFDSATADALGDFQSSKNIEVTRKANTETVDLINEWLLQHYESVDVTLARGFEELTAR